MKTNFSSYDDQSKEMGYASNDQMNNEYNIRLASNF